MTTALDVVFFVVSWFVVAAVVGVLVGRSLMRMPQLEQVVEDKHVDLTALRAYVSAGTRRGRHVTCPDCGEEVSPLEIAGHRRSQHHVGAVA